jgi:hypothetical protein
MTNNIMLVFGYAVFGIVSLILGYFIRVKRRADLIHSQPKRVLSDIPAFCEQVGTSMMIMGICLIVASVSLLIGQILFSSAAALIGIIFAAFWIVMAEYKYRR